MVENTDALTHQRAITRLCVQCALMLLQHGAETTLVEQLSTRLGIALGMDSVESAISANSVVLTTIYQDHCLTTTRKSADRGINMHVLTEVQHIVIQTEREHISHQKVEALLNQVEPLRYPVWLVVLMVGASCASFARLAGGGLGASLITFFVSSIAMFVRLKIAHMQINPIINFGITAFVATALCGLATRYIPVEQPSVAMAACILLLVPGFPLINSISDMFKGHMNTGLARWTVASWLTLATCIGVVIAITLLGLQGWV